MRFDVGDLECSIVLLMWLLIFPGIKAEDVAEKGRDISYYFFLLWLTISMKCSESFGHRHAHSIIF